MPLNIQKNISLAPHTTLKVGGPASFFCEPKNEAEILEAIKFAGDKNLRIFVLGGGSNVLVSDKGFDGLVIKIINVNYETSDTEIVCGSGCNLGSIVNESVKSGLTGLEWAAGIPGTIGGAIWGNAGAFGGEMADIVNSVKVLEITKSEHESADKILNPKSEILNKSKFQSPNGQNKLEISNYQLQECKFGYRTSIFKENPNLVILSAMLKLEKGDKEESEKKVREIIKQRNASQPTEFPSSGSFFKNPHLAGGQALAKNKSIIEEYKNDTGKIAADGVIPAGYLIDLRGLRGKRIGGAMVSKEHGNFLVNAGNAKAEDFIILAAIIKTRVRNAFGVQLREEVQMVGF